MKEKSYYYIWGKHPSIAAIANPNRIIIEVFCTKNALEDSKLSKALATHKCTVVTKDKLDSITQGQNHQGIAVKTLPVTRHDLREVLTSEGTIGIIDQITDPHNLGAILRSAAAFGVKDLILSKNNRAPENGILAKTASGALEIVRLTEVTNISRTIEDLKEAGYWVLGLDHEAKTFLQDYKASGKTAVVFGSEHSGIRPLVKASCDILLKIPMIHHPSLDSLNVATTASIAFYQLFATSK